MNLTTTFVQSSSLVGTSIARGETQSSVDKRQESLQSAIKVLNDTLSTKNRHRSPAARVMVFTPSSVAALAEAEEAASAISNLLHVQPVVDDRKWNGGRVLKPARTHGQLLSD